MENRSFMMKKALAVFALALLCNFVWAQTIPFTFSNTMGYPDDQVYVCVVGEDGVGHVWIDPVTGVMKNMDASYNTIPKPKPDAGFDSYANCFRKLSQISGKTINLPRINGCRIFISLGSQLYLHFFSYNGSPKGYTSPDMNNPSDPNQGIKYEFIELTSDPGGLWVNTTRVDSYNYPMGVEVWGGNGYYSKSGEIMDHDQIISQWQATAPSEFQGLLENGSIHFPTKHASFNHGLIQSYIDQIWSKYSGQQLVFNAGPEGGIWRGTISGNVLSMKRDGDNAVGRINGKPSTLQAMEASGVMHQGSEFDMIVQKHMAAAINRHALNLNLGSGAMQDFGNTANYYVTWPYNWYAKFFHRYDISYQSKTYAFSYDDVFDQSATIHTPSPINAKISIGGFAGQIDCEPIPIIPYLSVNGGSWQQTASATLNVGGTITLGPQPLNGKWKWLGPNGFSSTSRQITINNIQTNQSGDYVADYTTPEGCTSTLIFRITVNSAFSTKIEAESYVITSGVQKESCSEGGENVGWIDANDWMVWDVNLPSSGTYTVEYRVASLNGGGTLQLERAGGSPVYGTLGIPGTGNWQNWVTIKHTVTLSAGSQQIAIKALSGGWNINWLQITQGVKSATLKSATVKETKVKEIESSPIAVYPNPATDILNISGLSQDSRIEVFNLAGLKITEATGTRVDVSALPAGIYMVKVKTEGTVKQLKFIKQ